MKITSAHGSGGKMTSELIKEVFEKHFSNEILSLMEDAAVLTLPASKIAFTTDSFVVSPVFFPGGDIGKLAVCGTVNDLCMMGAVPKYLSAGFILEEGLDTEDLDKIAASMRAAADEAGVTIVAGDTKVVGGSGGVYINTSGIGMIETDLNISSKNLKEGDAVIISGYLGNHHACILSERLNIQNSIVSDCAPLCEMVSALLGSGIELHAMRDITRGGLATVLSEFAAASKVQIDLDYADSFADGSVQSFCDILGLDPLYMGNEGKMVVFVPQKDALRAVEVMKRSQYGENARIVGTVKAAQSPVVTIQTISGSRRILDSLEGEGLPRIC